MHITILQEHLIGALLKTNRIISPRPPLPALSCVLLSSAEDGLRVSATNLETTETLWLAARTEGEGSLCVPSRTITDFVSTLRQERVKLELKGDSLVLSCGRARAVIPGMSASEFPPLPSLPKKGEGERIPVEKFVEALESVLFSAATDEGRPLLTGIRIVKEGGGLLFASTDGYRLSVRTSDISFRGDADYVLPSRALSELVRIASDEKGEKDRALLFYRTKDGQAGFETEGGAIITRLLEGQYPDFKKIIPSSHASRAVIDREALAGAVKSASVFARDNANIVRLKLSDGSVSVEANAPQTGENTIGLEAKTEGDGGEIAFNSRFLVDFLSSSEQDAVIFEMTGSLNPGVFKNEGDDSFLHVIMPVRVQK